MDSPAGRPAPGLVFFHGGAYFVGNLDFGMWGNTPIVRLIAQNQPLQMITVGEGHFRFILATRKDSPIRNIADLKGKTVGALLGGTLGALSGYFGGTADQWDRAVLILTFSDGVTDLTFQFIGQVSPENRGGETKLLFRSAAGEVPAEQPSRRRERWVVATGTSTARSRSPARRSIQPMRVRSL
mgnify:CR=1 FL=1